MKLTIGLAILACAVWFAAGVLVGMVIEGKRSIRKGGKKMVFVFGSNLAGRHGKGAALYAKIHKGAIYGQGIGRQGDSYAIPTKDEKLHTLPVDRIKQHVDDFISYAKLNPEIDFEVTRIGCGLAGYSDRDIAHLFKDAPENCFLPEGWRENES